MARNPPDSIGGSIDKLLLEMCSGPRPLQADDEAEHQGGDPEETQLRHGPLLAERLHHTVSCHQELDQKGRICPTFDMYI